MVTLSNILIGIGIMYGLVYLMLALSFKQNFSA